MANHNKFVISAKARAKKTNRVSILSYKIILPNATIIIKKPSVNHVPKKENSNNGLHAVFCHCLYIRSNYSFAK